MLHYIVFPYVCDVALEVFRAICDRGAVGERGALGRGATSGFYSIPFHYVRGERFGIRFCGGRAVWEGEWHPDTALAPDVRR